MAFQEQKRVPEKLRKQLALAVTSIRWSYVIFWSISAKQPRKLEWGDGYYNGDIKTRKTVEAVELNSDELGLQRSDQLRELFKSLSLGETNPQNKRPTAALSPEDLTDAEWYFLVCMSFIFNFGQGLPGRTLAKNETIWLCNAHCADKKIFARALLAKSASIQTVVCFLYLGGVIELGTTELIAEDLNLIQHIKTSFLESPSATSTIVSKTLNHGSSGIISEVLDDDNMPKINPVRLLGCPATDVCSPNSSSSDSADNPQDLAGYRSEMQFKDDGINTNGLNNSMNSSDCLSETRGNPETIIVMVSDRNKTNHTRQQKHQLSSDDVHYQSVLSCILKSPHHSIISPYLRKGNRKSSFLSWNDRIPCCRLAQTGTPQRLLKKVLLEVARMHENSRVKSCKQNGKKDNLSKREVDNEVDRNHVLSERKRREKLNERFMFLGSLIPSGGKVDKVSILDHTIEYLRELERKVEELESATQSKPHDDAIERTSDNYGLKKVGNITNKRKACDTDKMAAINRRVRLREASTDNITVSITDVDVMIEMRCPWSEFVLLQVIDAITKLHLDSQSVQSSISGGILSISIKAKCKGGKGASAGGIWQALQKIMGK